MQERPVTGRLLISSVLIFCAQVSLAAAGDFSIPLSDALSAAGAADNEQGELLVRFVERSGPPASCPDLVGPRTQRSVREDVSARLVAGASVRRHYDGVVSGLALVKLPRGTSVATGLMKFMSCQDVLYAEPNFRYRLQRRPNDPRYPEQWALNNTGQSGGRADADIDAPEAWDITIGNQDFIVAVLDTGIDDKNADVFLNAWANKKEQSGQPDVDDDGNGQVDDFYGWDFVNGTSAPLDDVYHGTYVAGIIGARGNDFMGTAGVCWNCSLMICKVADKDGVKLDAAVAAIEYATASGVKVINASWGGPDYSQSLEEAIRKAGEKGVLFVAAAGNDSSNNDNVPFYPASYNLYNIISVLATNSSDQLAATSNYGPRSVDIAEPGENVLSTTPMEETEAMKTDGVTKEFGTLTGTSVAAPHVSGAAALLWSKYPSLSYYHVKHALMQSVDNVVPGLCLSQGRLNAAKALAVIPTGATNGKVINTRDPTQQYNKIQEAIDEAVDGDVLIADGKKTGNTLYNELIDFKGKAITLRSGSIQKPDDPNIYPETTFILGLTKEGSVVTFANGEGPSSVLKGFTIGWGVADTGAGIRCVDASPTITYCIISDNQARKFGGGFDCLGGAPQITNCVISNNVAFGSYGFGAGLNLEECDATIADCIIRNNSSMDMGGGVACLNANPTLFNCFITNNSAVFGAGQFDLVDSSPTITNGTIVVDENNLARDGGVCAYGDSRPTITNCILWGNGDDLLNCSATYSCIEDGDEGEGNVRENPLFTAGPRGTYYLSQTDAGQSTGSPCVNAGSPATDTSYATRLAALTTRTDSVMDSGAVDLGAHYGLAPVQHFPLIVAVVDAGNKPVDPNQAGGRVDPNGGSFREFEVVHLQAFAKDGYRIKRWVGTPDPTSKDPSVTLTMHGPVTIMIEFEPIPLFRLEVNVAEGGHGLVNPNEPELRRGKLYRDGTVVTLTAVPDAGYIVNAWRGTDSDASWANVNQVTVNGDKEVTVTFKLPRTLNVPQQYDTIAEAIAAAGKHGDRIILGSVEHPEFNLDFGGKAITIASVNPDDPWTVAHTVINCGSRGQAFVFKTGEGRDSVLDGFTIRNGLAVRNPRAARNGTGTDGLDAYGGAVACFAGTSPTLSNLIIQDCNAIGQDGENASQPPQAQPAPAPPSDPNDPNADPAPPGPPEPNATDPNGASVGLPGVVGADGAPGAVGADGAAGQPGNKGGRGGNGYGGAFYFEKDSAPLILHCTFVNSKAIGGNGGFGGQGQDGASGQDGQTGQAGQNGGPGGDGLNDGAQGPGGPGGAGGAGGNGGKGGDGGRGGDGGNGGEGLGGALWFGPNCKPVIKYCTIQDSYVRQGLGNLAGAGGTGGNGGNGGAGGAGGTAGDGEGEPAATDGQPGANGMGANAGAGGAGGNMGKNGTRSWGGAIFFGSDCEAELADTAITANSAISTVPTTYYAGGAGGAGGTGGSDSGAGGAGGAGGNGNPSGDGGAGGGGGNQGGPGANGSPGKDDRSVTTNYGGGIAYSEGCKVKLTNCTLSSNVLQNEDGGGEYYAQDCTTELIRCTLRGNTAGRNGAGQWFGSGCTITVEGSNYLSNAADGDGGGIYCTRDDILDINDSVFSQNSCDASDTPDTPGYGGGVYGGGVWDDNAHVWLNGGTIKVRSSQFTQNTATYGGGLYWHGEEATVDLYDCIIRENSAEDGGGLYWSAGAPRISRSSIKNNRATGSTYIVMIPGPTPDPNDPSTWPASQYWPDPNDPNSMWDPNNAGWRPPQVPQVNNSGLGVGGGFVCKGSDALIEDSTIGGNSVVGTGGGAFFEGASLPTLKNCLVKDNSATIGGGGLASYWSSPLTILNCTIVDNTAADPNVSNRGLGGGLFVTQDSQTTVLNSILWGNNGSQGDQIAIGSQSDPVYYQRPSTVTVQYSIVEGGAGGVHVEEGRTLNWLEGNLSDDPLFVDSYYLSQTSAGQSQTSPAVDAGSTTAGALALSQYTTRTDDVGDAGQVDIGFHYPGPGRYRLSVSVVGGHGHVTPLGGRYHEFRAITLVAVPDPNYRVKEWIGADVTPAWNQNTNTVTLDTGDKYVTVEFEENKTRHLLVPKQYRTIEDAVAAASASDTIITIGEGVHYISNPRGIDLQGKNVRIMSDDPNNPEKVANTIIDCAGARRVSKRGFWFHRGETPDCILEGVTIRNGYVIGALGANGVGRWRLVNPTDSASPWEMYYGEDITGIGYGGAILCENGSSPTIRKCVIENCTVVGAQAGDAADGFPIPRGSTQNADWGGFGGIGTGTGRGGAIACIEQSSPRISDCTFRNNRARGGCAGDGGDGSTPNDGSGWGGNGGNGGYGYGDGQGGALYADGGSEPQLANCTFVGNEALTGVGGVGGNRGPGGDIPDNYGGGPNPGNDGYAFTQGNIYGGAAYYAQATLRLINCRFLENQAYVAQPTDYILLVYALSEDDYRTYMHGGAVYLGPGSSVDADTTQFEKNTGGAVYVSDRCTVDFNECIFRLNTSAGGTDVFGTATGRDFSGGGLYVGKYCSTVNLTRCDFFSNQCANDGGGFRCESGARILDCVFSGNTAGSNGGGLDIFCNTGDPNNKVIVPVTVQKCSFGGNKATLGIYGQGGGIHFEDVNATVTDSYVIANSAKNGGGLLVTSGTLLLRGGAVSRNEATGGSGIDTRVGIGVTNQLLGLYSLYYLRQAGATVAIEKGAGTDMGGGLVCAGVDATIEQVAFQENAVRGPGGVGGAICFYGGFVRHLVNDCLFANNTSSRDGGAIGCNVYATPMVTNCTFAENTATRLGGAIFCDWSTNISVVNSIFESCRPYAIAEEDLVKSTIEHSLFHGNQAADFADYNTVSLKTTTMSGADIDVTNIEADPLFVGGPLGRFYLSQKQAGQDANSPAVNAGSKFAADVGLDQLTTRTDGLVDAGVADLGYHFPDHTALPKYRLTVQVVGGHGTVTPTEGEFYAGTMVPLTAAPESGWRVGQWSGTNDDSSHAKDNLVVIGPDRYVELRFEQPRTFFVSSEPNYTTLQHAIDESQDGDVVLIKSGTYVPAFPYPEIFINGKNITISGMNPDGTRMIAGTVLSRYQFYITNVGPDMIIDGLTIRDSHWRGVNGGNPNGGPDDGTDGVSLEGGAMVIVNASPTIRNCNFINCSVTGGNGGRGDDGTEPHPMGDEGGWAGWAYGGAIYCGYLSSPTFQNCTFANCYARGGNGGDGGNGLPNVQGGRGGNWEWADSIEQLWLASFAGAWDGWENGPLDRYGNPRPIIGTGSGAGYYFDYWKYSGYGGAIYCEFYSSPKFFDCNFTNNHTYGGVCGIGGTSVPTPSRRMNIENFGGAVYIGTGSNPEFTDCLFRDNSADTNTVTVPDDVYVSYGGAIACEDDCHPKFTRCTIADGNACIGGGLWLSNASLTMTDCTISGNVAYHGGGLYTVDSEGTVAGTTVSQNRAFRGTIDPNSVLDPNYSDIYSWGGGIACLNSPLLIRDSIIVDNRAAASGGGIYFGGNDNAVAPAPGTSGAATPDPNVLFEPTVHDSLIRGNSAGRDGGGISANWYAEPIISNCTIVENLVSGAYDVSYGGGVAGNYDSNTVIVNSILWGNTSSFYGSQVAATGGYEYGPRPSAIHIRYSDIQPDFDPNAEDRQPLDVVFLIDSTSSMVDDINAVKISAADIMDRIAEAVPDWRAAVADYRDFNDGTNGAPTDYPFQVVSQFRSDAAQVVQGINAITIGDGMNFPESVYYALRQAIDGNPLGGWRSGKVDRVILLIGDAYPHDPEPGTNLTLAQVIEMANLPPTVRVFPIQVGNDLLTATYFRSLASGTGAPMLQVEDANSIVAAIMNGINLISGGASSIHVDPGAKVPGWDAQAGTWNPDTRNMGTNPLFVAGYYLSQPQSGQMQLSPAVDAGSGAAAAPNIALSTRTTRTDGVYDVNTVDLGYHYQSGLVQYRMTASVIADPNTGLTHGTVEPNTATVYPGFGNDTVDLTALPDEGYKVKRWKGTDDDRSTKWTNKVTVTKDTQVFVEFEPATQYQYMGIVIDRGSGTHGTLEPVTGLYYDGKTIPLRATPDPNYQVRKWTGVDDPNSRDPNNTVTINGADAMVTVEFGPIGENLINVYDQLNNLVPGSPFLTVREAINVARANYRVVLSDGIYSGPGNYNLDMSDQPTRGPNDVWTYTIESLNGPNDCIIDCQRLGRAFIFDTNEDPNYILRGVTIRYGYAAAVDGQAQNGGGILINAASPTIDNCRILNCQATGNGGGIAVANGSPVIQNTWVSSNRAAGFGGGFHGENGATAAIINCLFTLNYSQDIGGAIFLQDSDATITLSTIAYNYGLGYFDSTEDDPGADLPKGGIACRDSNPTITDCIIGRSGALSMDALYGEWGDATGQGDDLYGCSATFSCIENGDGGDNNTSEDPLWVTGPLGAFYLSQLNGGQSEESPCINAGEQYVLQTLQDTYALGQITTSIRNTADTGYADMGYHYPFYTGPAIHYKLTISVVGNGRATFAYYPDIADINDFNDPNVFAKKIYPVEPGTVVVHYLTPGQRVEVNAVPDPGQRLYKWQGTDADASTARQNTVSMDADKVVIVFFEKKTARTLTVPGGFSTIQDAVNAAREGDTVIVDPGRYFGGYNAQVLIIDKSILVTSRAPHDPCCVESTIIDGYLRTNNWTNLGVVFTSNADSGTVFNGFTIQNCGGRGGDGDDGDRDQGHPNGEDGAVLEGAGIFVMAGARPMIKNCLIRDNILEGGNGGNGVGADENNNAGRGGWGGWAHGAGAYCAPYSGPRFINCRFENNRVSGGNGGNGGNQADNGGTGNYGGNWSISGGYNIASTGLSMELEAGNLWEVWEWDLASYWLYLSQGWITVGGTVTSSAMNLVIRDPNAYQEMISKTSYAGDYRWYSGYGAGVFCDFRSDVAFEHCEVRGNRVYGGMSGQGGTIGPGGRTWEPLLPFEIPTYGAGAYCAKDARVTFKGCTFEDNLTSPSVAGTDPNHRLDPYIGYGGGLAAEGCALLVLTDCNFVSNLADTGGALYVADCNATVIDCNIIENQSLRGAGFAGTGGVINIASSEIRRNLAITDPNDTTDDAILPLGGGLFCWSADAQVQDCEITDNATGGSGGGIYIRGENATTILNCLLRNNIAMRDGGGISTNWYATPTIRNCTFTGNASPGLTGDPNFPGYGGAVFCGYESICQIVDTILWENFAVQGSELAVGSGYELDRRCGQMLVSFSDITQGPNDVFVDNGCKLIYGDGIFHKDPLFVSGPLGDFFLSNSNAGPDQTRSSPCLDTGSNLAGNVGMSRYTTRTDRVPDTGRVDIGFHYPFLEPCRFCDLILDGEIQFNDFAKFAQNWLDEGCAETDGWCGGADFTFDSRVDARDLAVFADCWLVKDVNPPVPDPMEWETEPRMVNDSEAYMEAKEAMDGWGWPVEYYFECLHGGGASSGWTTSRVYHATGLARGMEYGYRVRARDALGNMTGWSEVRYAGERDVTPPAGALSILTIGPDPAQPTLAITMTASTLYDKYGVQYYFEADPNGSGAKDSGWINTATYTDANLVPDTAYRYRVKARDLSANRNETAWSAWKSTRTAVPAERIPPTPDPMAFATAPAENKAGPLMTDFYVEMVAVTATDAASPPVEYFFECSESGFNSGWQTETGYSVQVGRTGTGVKFRVKARDALGNQTGWSDWYTATPLPNVSGQPQPITPPGGNNGNGTNGAGTNAVGGGG